MLILTLFPTRGRIRYFPRNLLICTGLAVPLVPYNLVCIGWSGCRSRCFIIVTRSARFLTEFSLLATQATDQLLILPRGEPSTLTHLFIFEELSFVVIFTDWGGSRFCGWFWGGF